MKRHSKFLITAPIIGALCSLAMVACSSENQSDSAESARADLKQRVAIAELSPTDGNEVTGTVTFIEERNGIRVIADVRGLKEGKHGFHVHENGDCSAPDGSSAGGHFNPDHAEHASPDAAKRHTGDLGNLTSKGKGGAMLEYVDSHLSFDGPRSIIGKAVIVHEGEDDFSSQPSGDAGARIACGVVEMFSTRVVDR